MLKSEIDQNFKFIISLVDLFYWLTDDNLRFWYKKTILILTASIVEAILHYTIKVLEIKHNRCFGVKLRKDRLIYQISSDESIYSYREKKVSYDSEEMTFNDCIMILWDEAPEKFTWDICDKIHEIRRLRNGVHIHETLSINPEFNTMDFGIFFSYTKAAIDACESVIIS